MRLIRTSDIQTISVMGFLVLFPVVYQQVCTWEGGVSCLMLQDCCSALLEGLTCGEASHSEFTCVYLHRVSRLELLIYMLPTYV